MLSLTKCQSLDQMSLNDYHVIVLVEGSEAEIFAHPDRWFDGIEVLAVDCGGFSGVGALYETLARSHRDRLLPTVDQDSLERQKGSQSASAWNSPNLHIFSWTFEDVLDDWMLVEVLCNRWSKFGWVISEEELKKIRHDAQARRVGLYEAIAQYGLRKYPDQGLRLPDKPALARSLGNLMWCNYWLPPGLRPWVKEIYATGGLDTGKPWVPTRSFEFVDWELARSRGLSGFLIACYSGKLIGIDFDEERAGDLATQPAHVRPSANPMWSPDGESLLFQGKSIRRTKTVAAVLKPDGQESVVDIGGIGRGTSVSDWDPTAQQFFYVHGADLHSYRMWRRALNGSSTVPIEPETHGGVVTKIGRKTVGLGSANNRTHSFELRDTVLVDQKYLTNWHPQAEPHESTAIAWDYNRNNGSFAIAQPTVNGVVTARCESSREDWIHRTCT